MSNLFRSTTIKGTRITDFSQTSARVGDPIPFGYGTFPVDGNVIWAPLPPKEHVAKKRQGKGGVKQETFTYTLSYAICFGRGRIQSYLWIKRNGKVVYTTDPAAPVEDQAYAAKWAEKATFYYGDGVQLPDSTIEAYEGVGNVSAFRRDAYIVVEDDDVTEGGGAVPTYEACVIYSGIQYSTSRPYPLETEEAYLPAPAGQRGQLYMIPIEEYEPTVGLIYGELRQPVKTYAAPPEEYEPDVDFVSGELRAIVKPYQTPPEAYEPTIGFVSGSLKQIVISYQTPPEAYEPTIGFISGSLT